MTSRLCLLLVLLAGPLRAEDWAEFRGPTGQGLSKATKVPTDFNPTTNVAWKADLPGGGWSSPVVVGGKVYLTTGVQEKGKGSEVQLRALCLDAGTGKVLWDELVFTVAKPSATHGKNSHASPTPIVAGERVYVHFGQYGTACLDLAGKVKWKNDELKYAPVHGNGGSPVLVDGLLVFSRDGATVREVIALDADTGKVRWKTARSGSPPRKFSFSTPLVITVNGKKQIVSPASDHVAGYDVTTGEEVWKVTYSGYSVIPRPVFAHGLLYIVTGYDTSSVMAIRAGGKGDVTKTHVEWTVTDNPPHTPSLLVVGDELYMVSDKGFASCLDAKKGTVHWSQRLSGSGYSASPVYADGKVYFLSENGIATVVKAGTKYEQVARNDLKEPRLSTLASPAVIDGALFVRTKDGLYRFK